MSTLAQSSPTLQNRYTNVARSPHTRFDQGMIRDVASWELPEGAAYDVVDMLCDYVGKVRKRGGWTAPTASSSTARVENILGYCSNGVDGVTGLFGSAGKTGAQATRIDPTTGALQTILSDGTNATFACRPFQHANLMVFPFQALDTTANTRNKLYIAGGATAAGNTPTAAVVTLGDNRVTGILPATLTSGMLGAIVELNDGGTHYYAGRIVEITSTSAIRVEPVPQASFNATAGTIALMYDSSTLGGDTVTTGRYGCSYQNRIILAYTLTTQGTATSGYAKGLDIRPNRIMWSLLPTDPIPVIGSANMDGDPNLFPGLFGYGTAASPFFNFLDFPNLGPSGITAVAVAGEGNLIVFGQRQMYRVTGTLDTETVQSPAFDFTEGLVSANVGCIAQRSVQYTARGLVFAALDNIYAFDGSAMTPLLSGRNQRYYQDRLRAGDRPVGSAYSLNKNHYLLSMNGSDVSSLLINLETYALTRITNTQLFDSTPDPSDATKLWGVKWWDTTTTAPTFTVGQTIRLDPIWLPTQANSIDADGTAVLFDYQSASFVDGALSTNKLVVDVQITRDHRGTGTPTATFKVDSKLNTADASYATIDAAMPATTTSTLTKSYPTGTLIAEGQAVEFRITGNNVCASFELLGLDVGTQHRPDGFST